MSLKVQFGLVKISFGRLTHGDRADEDLELKNVQSISFRGVDKNEVFDSISRDNLAIDWGDREIAFSLTLIGGFQGESGLTKNSQTLIKSVAKEIPVNFFFKFGKREGFSRPFPERLMKLAECHPTRMLIRKSETNLVSVSIDFIVKQFKLF